MEALGLGNTEEYAIFDFSKIYFHCFLGAHTFKYTPTYLSHGPGSYLLSLSFLQSLLRLSVYRLAGAIHNGVL